MNRRRFIQSLAAVLSLPAVPALSFRAATAAVPVAVAVPAHARSWAIYMSTLHGECTPQTLQKLLNIPAVDAKKYVGQLLVEGAIKPNPLLQNSVSKLVKSKENSLLDKVKKRLEMKARVGQDETDILEEIDVVEALDGEVEWLEKNPETDSEAVIDEEPAEAITAEPIETENRS